MRIDKKEFEQFLKIHRTADMDAAKWKLKDNKLYSAISTSDRTVIGIISVDVIDNEIDKVIPVLNTEDLLKSISMLDDDVIEVAVDNTYLYIYSSEVNVKLMLARESMIPKRSILTSALKDMMVEGIDYTFEISEGNIKKLKRVYSIMGKPEFITIEKGKLIVVKDSNESHKVEITQSDIPDIDVTFDMSNFLDIIIISGIRKLEINTSQKTCKIGELFFKSV